MPDQPPTRGPRRFRRRDLLTVPFGFAALILLGAALLSLPQCHTPGCSPPLLDNLFIAVSAACVTGLATVDIAKAYSTLGHAIILALIQIGGIGISTAGLLFIILGGRRLSLGGETAVTSAFGRLRSVRPRTVLLASVTLVFGIELAGAAALFAVLPGHSPPDAWTALFHSISAFCNAGFSTLPGGTVNWRHNTPALLLLATLVIAGGIGLITLINLLSLRPWRRDPRRRGILLLQSRVALAAAAALLLTGAAVTLVFESSHSLRDTTPRHRIVLAFYHSAMTRTAGFNADDLSAMHPATLLVSCLLMFIGGAPGSTAGGVKTVSVFVLAVVAWTALRRRTTIQALGRRLPPVLCADALLVVLAAALLVLGGYFALVITESSHPAALTPLRTLALLFETVSAFATVGLSTGITPLLTSPGKSIIMLLMFLGRVGPLMLALHLARPSLPNRVRAPYEEVALG